jgi:hypothetical protein
LISCLLDPDPDPGGKKCSTKKGKSEEICCFEVLDVLLLRATGFFCSLNFLQEDIKIKILQFLIKFLSNM